MRPRVALRIAGIAVAAVSALALLLAAGGAWLFATEAGARFVAARAAASLADFGVRLGGVGGTLRDGIELRDVEVDLGAMREAGTEAGTAAAAGRIHVAALRIEPVWAALFARRAELRTLHADAVEIDLVAGDSAPPDLRHLPVPVWPAIALPLPVRVDALVLNALRVRQGDATVFDGRVAAVLAADADGLRVETLSASGAPWFVQAHGHLPWRPDGALEWQTDWRREDADTLLTGILLAHGTPARIDFTHRLEQPYPVVAEGRVAPGFGTDHGAAPSADPAAGWNPGFEVRLAWPALRVEGVELGAGRAALRGALFGFELDAEGAVRPPLEAAAPIAVRLRANGDPDGLTIDALRLDDGAAQAEADGRVRWAPVVEAGLQVRAQGVDPGRWAAAWPGRVDARFRVEARVAEDRPAVTLGIEQLAGSLRGAPLSGTGALAWRGDELRIDALALASGTNRLDLSGRIDGLDRPAHARFDIAGGVALPDPAALLTDASGRAEARFTVRGRWSQPAVDLRATGQDFRWPGLADGGLAIGRLDVDWHWPAQGALRGHAETEAIRLGTLAVPKARLSASGEIAAHRVSLAADVAHDGTAVHVDADLDGGLDGDAAPRWRGRIARLALSGAATGTWRLAAPAVLDLGDARAHLARACLTQDNAEVCAQADWDADRGLRAEAGTQRLPASRVLALGEALGGVGLPSGITGVKAELNASARLDGPRVEARLAPLEGQLRWRDPPLDLPARLAFRIDQAEYRGDARGGRLDAAVDLGTHGRVRLGLDHGGAAPEAIAGHLHAESEDLGWLAGALPMLAELRGDLSVDAEIGGRRDAPTVRGDGRVRVAHAGMPDLGIAIDAAELRVHAEPGQGTLTLSGDARVSAPPDGDVAARSGTLRLAGRFDPATQDLAVRLDGDAVPVLRLADVRVAARPALCYERDARGERLRGEIEVPSAWYHVASLPEGRLAASPDEVIVGADAPANVPSVDGSAPARRALDADLTLRLGDDVRIDAFDLKARLTGRVRMQRRDGRDQAEGRIDLPEGSYRAYGQQLDLTRGHLLFAGPPDNPGLDLRAARVSADGATTAYLDVAGTLQAPRLTVGSDPAGSDADALAYLLTGRALDQAGQGGRIDVYAAALGLGIDRGSPQIATLRRELGLDELGVETGAGIEETAVKLGKYLNPNLFVGYSLNVFDNTGAALARLRLGDGLELEGRSGQTQSVDLIYKIESP